MAWARSLRVRRGGRGGEGWRSGLVGTLRCATRGFCSFWPPKHVLGSAGHRACSPLPRNPRFAPSPTRPSWLAAAAAVPAKAASPGGRQVVFPAKLSYGDDTRLLQVGPAAACSSPGRSGRLAAPVAGEVLAAGGVHAAACSQGLATPEAAPDRALRQGRAWRGAGQSVACARAVGRCLTHPSQGRPRPARRPNAAPRRCPLRCMCPPCFFSCTQLVPGVTYLELMEHVRQLYPALGPFVLKFVDK